MLHWPKKCSNMKVFVIKVKEQDELLLKVQKNFTKAEKSKDEELYSNYLTDFLLQHAQIKA